MVRLIDGLETTGVSTSYRVYGAHLHTVSVFFTNSGGSVTALAVSLEGSLDGSNFFELGSHTFDATDLSAQGAMFHVAHKPVEYVRARITSLAETGTTAVYVDYSGGGM